MQACTRRRFATHPACLFARSVPPRAAGIEVAGLSRVAGFYDAVSCGSAAACAGYVCFRFRAQAELRDLNAEESPSLPAAIRDGGGHLRAVAIAQAALGPR